MDIAERRPGQSKLLAIQAGRGVAALLVVLAHGTISLSLPQYSGTIAFGHIFRFGHAGVDFFFVLSGFIITYVHQADIGNPRRFSRYVWRRITRIYPPYWIVTFLLLAGLLASGHFQRVSLAHLIASLALVPYAQPPVLGVAWTLQHEMLFYACFGLAILWRPAGLILLAACLGLVAIALVVPPAAWWWAFLTSPFHLQFVMGLVAARWVLARRVPAPCWLAVTGGLLFTAAAIAEDTNVIAYLGLTSKLMFGFASMALVAGLAEAEGRGLIRVGFLGALIGGASYALYLLHELVINDAAFLLARIGLIKIIPAGSMLLILVPLTVAIAIAFYVGIEQPLLHGLGRNKVTGRVPLRSTAKEQVL